MADTRRTPRVPPRPCLPTPPPLPAPVMRVLRALGLPAGDALERHGVDTAAWWDRQLALSLLGMSFGTVTTGAARGRPRM